MAMGWIWTGMILVSVVCAAINGTGADLAAATVQGARNGIDLALAMAGSMILWSGVGKMMESTGITVALSRLFMPFLKRIFPSVRKDPVLAQYLSANICANFLGLGNAATPMGIQAARRMVDPDKPSVANHQLCRLIVLNTASIQFIPSTVAALRAGYGCATPFDILPAVWVSSICSAGVGLLAAFILGKLWPDA